MSKKNEFIAGSIVVLSILIIVVLIMIFDGQDTEKPTLQADDDIEVVESVESETDDGVWVIVAVPCLDQWPEEWNAVRMEKYE